MKLDRDWGRLAMSSNRWQEIKMGDVIDTVSIKHKFDKDKIILVNTSDVLEGKVLNHEYVENRNLRGQFKKSFHKDDILYSEIRPRNMRFAYIDFDSEDYVASTKLMVLRKKNNQIISDFLYQILKSEDIINKLQIIAESRSGTFPQITFTELSRLNILLPPISEQKIIADTLSCLDDKIEQNRRINDNLEQQSYAMYCHYFLDLADPKWNMTTLAALGSITGGSTPSKSKPEYFADKGIAWITPKDLSINKNKFITRGQTDITELGYRNSSAQMMPEGSVLFSSRAPIGYIAIASNDVCTNQGFKSIVPKTEVGTAYVYYFLKHNLSKIEGMATGSTFKEVSGSIMKNVPAIIPDADALNLFNTLCDPIFKQQERLEQENLHLALIRDTLLPRLMSGELSVVND